MDDPWPAVSPPGLVLTIGDVVPLDFVVEECDVEDVMTELLPVLR